MNEISNFWKYVGATGLFWALTIAFEGGSPSLKIEPIAIILNVVLLPGLWRGSEVARVILVVQAALFAFSIAFHGVWVAWEAFTVLSPIAALQLFLLWRIGRKKVTETAMSQVASASQ
jgi:hypothetical protein